MSKLKPLSEQEKLFCELYVHGDAPYAGNASKCYQEVFHSNCKKNKFLANRLLEREEVKAYVEELENMPTDSAKNIKKFLTENLMSIIDYCSTTEFRDKQGRLLSPAPLRSVAVAATKALMELYPVKEARQTQVSIDGGAGNGGITFNVILPEQVEVKPDNTAEE